MDSIDLIPSVYRHERAIRRSVRLLSLALASIASLGFCSWMGLQWLISSSQADLATQREKADHAIKLHQELSQLTARKSGVEEGLAVLNTLQGSGEALRIMQALDEALNDNVLLTGMQFDRIRKKLDPAATAATGSSEHSAAFTPLEFGTEKWKLYSTVQLHGVAGNYGALADFIQALGKQPGIVEVRFLNSSARTGNHDQVLEFTASASFLPHQKVLP